MQHDTCIMKVMLGCKQKKPMDYMCIEDNATSSELPSLTEFFTEADGGLCHQWNCGID